MYKYIKYSVDHDKDKSEKVIKVTVDTKEIQKSIEKAIETVRAKAKIKGFRPGNAPKEVIVNSYQPEIVNESSNDLFNDLLNQILEKEKIMPIAIAQVANEETDKDGNSIIVFKVPVYAAVQIPELDKVKVEQDKVEVSEKEIEDGIKRIWTNYKKEDQPEEPAFTDKMFKEMKVEGVNNMEELKDWVKKSIEDFKKAQLKDKFGQDFLNKAIEQSGIAIHEQIVEDEANKREGELRNLATQDKTTLEDVLKSHEMTLEEYRKKMRDEIVMSVKMEIFLRELSKHWNIEITEDEINEELKNASRLVARYNNDVDYVKQLIKDSLLRNKAFLKIIETYYKD